MEKQNQTEQSYPLIGENAPNFQAFSLREQKEIRLESIVHRDIILVFMNSSCVYCDNNFEVFLNEANTISNIDYALVMNKSEYEDANKLYDLYEKKINVFLTTEQTFLDYKLAFWPSFIHINRNHTIENITPIPILILKKFKIT